jgi:hypothetical protein
LIQIVHKKIPFLATSRQLSVNMMGIATLHPSYMLRAAFNPDYPRAKTPL